MISTARRRQGRRGTDDRRNAVALPPTCEARLSRVDRLTPRRSPAPPALSDGTRQGIEISRAVLARAEDPIFRRARSRSLARSASPRRTVPLRSKPTSRAVRAPTKTSPSRPLVVSSLGTRLPLVAKKPYIYNYIPFISRLARIVFRRGLRTWSSVPRDVEQR